MVLCSISYPEMQDEAGKRALIDDLPFLGIKNDSKESLRRIVGVITKNLWIAKVCPALLYGQEMCMLTRGGVGVGNLPSHYL